MLVAIYIIFACNSKSSEQTQKLTKLKYETQDPSLFEDLAMAYESSDRIAWQQPDKVLDILGNLENKCVADIGAGTGFFSFRLAERAKKVIAIDIDTMSINYIDSIWAQMPHKNMSEIETRLATADDSKLKKGEADVVLLVNTYPFIQNRSEYFQKLKTSLDSGAQIMIIDFKMKKLPVGPPSSMKVALSIVEKEMETIGFRLIKSDDRMLDYQYIVLFEI